jgi:hypothetical protein
MIVFYILSVGSYFQPDVYRFEDRLTYHQYFDDRYLFSELVDHIVISIAFLGWSIITIQNMITKWIISIGIGCILLIAILASSDVSLSLLSLVSLPSVIGANILNKRHSIVHPQPFKLTLNYLLISVAILSVISIFISTSYSDVNDPFIDMLILLSRFSPAVMLLLIFSAPIKSILHIVGQDIPVLRNRFQRTMDSLEQIYTRTSKYGSGQLVLILGALMTLSVIMILIPNTDDMHGPIGEDTLTYVNWAADLQSSASPDQVYRKSFVEIQDGDRPLSLFLLYLASLFLPLSAVTIIEFVLPALVAPALVLTIYFLTKELTSNNLVVLFTCFVTAISFQVIAGMYAGLLANGIALLPAYVSLIFLAKYLKTSKKLYWLLFIIALIILLLTHTYTWTIIIIFVVLFNIVLLINKKYTSNQIILVFVALSMVIVVDLLKSAITGSTLGLTRDLVLAEATDYGFTQFDIKWGNLVHVTQVHMAGIFGNIILLLLAIYGTMSVKYKSTIGIFVLVFISIAILPLFFGGKVILSRVLYDIPFQIPVGLAMTSIFYSKQGKLKVIVVIFSLLAVSIYIMFNLASIEQNI